MFVKSERRSIAPHCREIRERLTDFAANRLGPMAKGEVQVHLVDCQACSEELSELLMGDIESGAIPLLEAPSVPAFELYEQYLAAGRDATPWARVRSALQGPDTDASTREWAASKIVAIQIGFQALVSPERTRGAIRTRGAVRVRGASLAARLRADVLGPGGEASGATVAFEVRTPPSVTADGHFTLELRTTASEFDGRRVVCTIELSDTEAVSFEGIVTARESESTRTVVIDEEGLPGPVSHIPMDRVSVAID